MKMDFIKPSGMDNFNIETQNENWNKAQTAFAQMAPGILAKSEQGAIVTVKDASNNPLYATVHGKTEQTLTKHLTSLTEVSGGLQTNEISINEGDVVVANCSRKMYIDRSLYLEDGMVAVETGTAYLETQTIPVGSAKAFSLLFRGATSDDTITITVNGSEHILPSPIHGAGESGSIEVKTCKKNLLKNNAGSKTTQNVTFTKNNDGSVTVNGTASASIAYDFMVLNKPPISGKYTLSFGSDFANVKLAYMVLGYKMSADENYTYPTYRGLLESHSGEIPKDAATLLVRLRVDAGAVFDNVVLYPQLELGETATDYESYTEITANIPLSAPLYKCDYIRYNLDGSGNENHKQFEMILDGSEDWGMIKGETKDYFYINIGEKGSVVTHEISCTHFTQTLLSSTNENVGIDLINSQTSNTARIAVRPNNDGITDLATWKAWLAENTPKVVCELTEPTVTQLTAEQVAEFEKLQPFYPVTNATTSEGEISIEYIADTKRYIDNKIEELQNAILTSV